MAKKKKVTGADIDWYLISIDRLKQIGLILLLVLLAGAGWFIWNKQKPDPRNAAERAIADAKEGLDALASSKDFSAHRSEFDIAQKKLDEANGLFAGSKFVDAEGAAVESQRISRSALSGGAVRENDAQILTVEGDVQYQKPPNDFQPAEVRTPLFNGDWVKTGNNSSAELMFANGSLYTVGPNALLEIYMQLDPATSKRSNAVQMQVGTVEIATSDDASTVKTPSSQVVVDSESTTQVGVDGQTKATSVVATKGSASVAAASGGAPVKLASFEKVTAQEGAPLSPVKKLLAPPNPETPFDNQVFSAGETKVDFTWDPAPGAAGYILQVSRSQNFTTLEINSRRQKTSASARLTGEGAFYWRVASTGTDGDPGPFTSPPRRFRATGTGRETGTAANAEAPPPKLVLNKPFLIGSGNYFIEGNTDPGATVSINNEEVDVDSSGHFKKLITFNKVGRNEVIVKAVNPAGKQTVQSVTVLVEE